MNTEESWSEFKPHIGKSTIKKYIRCINVLNKCDTLEEKKQYIEESLPSPLTRQTYASCLIEYERMQKNDVEELEEWAKKFTEEFKEHYKKIRVLTVNEEIIENRIQFIRSEYERLKKYWVWAQHLLLILLYKHHPLRNVYREMKKKNYDIQKDNYIDENYVIHLNQYKNANLKGEYTTQIENEEIKKLIDDITTDYIIVQRKPSRQDVPISERGYVNYVKEVCTCTSTEMRRLFASLNKEAIDEEFIEKYNKAKEVAAKLDHSVDVHLNVYYSKQKSTDEIKKEADNLRYKLFAKH